MSPSDDLRVYIERYFNDDAKDGIQRALADPLPYQYRVYRQLLGGGRLQVSIPSKAAQARAFYRRVQTDLALLREEDDGVEYECADPCGPDGCVCLRRGFARAFDDRVSREGRVPDTTDPDLDGEA